MRIDALSDFREALAHDDDERSIVLANLAHHVVAEYEALEDRRRKAIVAGDQKALDEAVAEGAVLDRVLRGAVKLT